ncbi:MAG: dihydroneopterin aldolase [Acidimicrobiales bacterium]
MADQIQLRGLRALGTHGALSAERTQPQPFEVDLDLDAELDRPAATDDLGDTLDYGLVAEAVAGVIGGEPVTLLEHLAERIADAVLACADGSPLEVRSVTVTVRKLRPPVPVDLATAAVRLARTRRPPGRKVVGAPERPEPLPPGR